MKLTINIPDNATNGDVVLTMFPEVKADEFYMTVHTTTNVIRDGVKGGISYDFWKEWWNAPYKAEEREQISDLRVTAEEAAEAIQNLTKAGISQEDIESSDLPLYDPDRKRPESEDAIEFSEKDAIKMLKSKMDGHTDTSYEWAETARMAIKALEQESVLDKIRAEIKQLPYQRIFGNVSNYSLLDTVVEIIDKYRGAAGIEKDYQTATGGEVIGTDPNSRRNERIHHSRDKGAGGIFS